MDEFDNIIQELDNAQTPKALQYLIKRANNVMRSFRESGFSKSVASKYKRTVKAIKSRLRSL